MVIIRVNVVTEIELIVGIVSYIAKDLLLVLYIKIYQRKINIVICMKLIYIRDSVTNNIFLFKYHI